MVVIVCAYLCCPVQVYFKQEQHSVAAIEASGDVSLVIIGNYSH